MRLASAFLIFGLLASAQQPTPLWRRGYSVIPTPRGVRLAQGDVELNASWALAGPDDIAARTLRKDFQEFHGIALRARSSDRVIRLAITAGTVKTGAEDGIDRQAYRLRISPSVVEITGNAAPGLFYGVQTLIQLARRDGAGRLLVPEGVIEDWPALQLRFLHWDLQQQQDRIETLKQYIDWSARFKANMIAFQLEDKFEYRSHPLLGMPGAYTTAQLQDLVNYGLERHIQIVPLIQAPAHFSWALKHPELADLRSDGNNYEANLCDPRTYDLIFSLYDDVIAATRGVDYFFASTDEMYYVGIDSRCGKPYNPENRSLAWIEFVRRAHEHLAGRGRKMLIWAEYPLLAEHAKLLPPGIIDGVAGDAGYLPWEAKLGIRHLRYVALHGGNERHFPSYLTIDAADKLPPSRLEIAYSTIAHGRRGVSEEQEQAGAIGVFGAAWVTNGLHKETFWLGWATAAQYAWNPAAAPLEQHVAEFMRAYYGPRAEGMVEVYRLMQRQARAWDQSWDRVPSKVRGLAYGNSYGKGIGTQRWDITLPPPPLPQMPDLSVAPSFVAGHGKLLAVNHERMLENSKLLLALQSNLAAADRNRYNLEVFIALSGYFGHHWKLLSTLAAVETALLEARKAAAANDPVSAVGFLAEAHNAVSRSRAERLGVFKELKAVFEKSQYERGRSVGGRNYFYGNDDSKDYWAQRRPDLTYMTAPEESIGLDEWTGRLRRVTESYAREKHVPLPDLAKDRLEE